MCCFHPDERSHESLSTMSLFFATPGASKSSSSKTMRASLGTWSTCEDVIHNFPESAAALRGSTIIVTGASAGIGEEAAFHLARFGLPYPESVTVVSCACHWLELPYLRST
jgi:hypothetical protein